MADGAREKHLDTIVVKEVNESTPRNNMEVEKLLTGLAEDYSKFLRTDVKLEKGVLEENIDEVLTRLDEFCGLVDMVRSDDTLCLSNTLPLIYAKSLELEKIFERIDKLEAFIEVVRQNLDVMEEKVIGAEYLLGGSSVKKFFSSLPKPIFSKKSSNQDRRLVKYEPPEIFSTSDYLQPLNQASAEGGIEAPIEPDNEVLAQLS
ncbi:biogenesis of lysosome-related organelles complex 1 subunit 4 isoform X1 [Tachypleus tridentatus]|uniref:biogenesis of lysosome-related organelles complex 1 subunit 4 isoform X1 n=1 Tax=Tachypleus tridentatus TaxID=6853 RepID=UPI003FD59B43